MSRRVRFEKQPRSIPFTDDNTRQCNVEAMGRQQMINGNKINKEPEVYLPSKENPEFLALVAKFYRNQKMILMYENPIRNASLSTTRVRQRLCDLMGTDVIRLNDKRYFQKLSKRLEEEYDTVMDKQEETRAARENERLRRLMLEGVIDAPNDYRAVVHGDHKPKHKKTKKRKIKRRIRLSDSPSDYSTEHAQSEMTRHSDDDDNLTSASKEDIRTQVEFLSEVKENQDDDVTHEPSDSKPVLTSIIRKPGQNKNNDKSKNRAEMHARPPHHENTLRSSSSCSTYRKSRRIKSAAPRLSREADIQSDESTEDIDDQRYDTQSLPDRGYNRRDSKYSKHEPESVRRLRREQTVAGLYSIAEELVSPVRAEDSSRDKKVTSKS